MNRPVSALLYVQHLLGIGHLKRAAILAQHLSARGLQVTVVSGGTPVNGITFGAARLVQLPPVRTADAKFSILVDQDGAPISSGYLDARRILMRETYRDTAPDIVITEHFPFGRRKLGPEILTLLDASKMRQNRPWVVASVRDVLVAPRDPKFCADCVDVFYDEVLVHGDPAVVPFSASFALAERIAPKTQHTGYVVEDGFSPAPDGFARREILVSAGGGTDAASLIETALAARELCSARDAPWRILTGPTVSDDDLTALRSQTPPSVVIERFRPDLPVLLAHCRLSISRAGYNTMAETVAGGARCVVVPFETERETEQVTRAERFAAEGLCTVVRQAELTPERLAQAIDAALAGLAPRRDAIRLDGASASAHLLAERIESSFRAARPA